MRPGVVTPSVPAPSVYLEPLSLFSLSVCALLQEWDQVCWSWWQLLTIIIIIIIISLLCFIFWASTAPLCQIIDSTMQLVSFQYFWVLLNAYLFTVIPGLLPASVPRQHEAALDQDSFWLSLVQIFTPSSLPAHLPCLVSFSGLSPGLCYPKNQDTQSIALPVFGNKAPSSIPVSVFCFWVRSICVWGPSNREHIKHKSLRIPLSVRIWGRETAVF